MQFEDVPHPFPAPPSTSSGTTPIGLTVVNIHVLVFDISHRNPLFHRTESDLLPPTILTDVPGIGHTPALQVPLLDTANDVHTQLSILLQRILPVRRDGITQGQVSRHAADHHLAHLVVFARVGVDVLHPPQARVGFVVVVEGAHGLDDVVAQLGDLELLAEEVEVEERSHVLFGLRVAQGAGVEPADEEFEGEIVRVGEAEGFGFALAVFLVVEDVAEEGGVVAQELFVYGPRSVFGADVDVNEGGGEESGTVKLVNWHVGAKVWTYWWRGLSGCSEEVDMVVECDKSKTWLLRADGVLFIT